MHAVAGFGLCRTKHSCIKQSHIVLWVFMCGRSCTPSPRKRSSIASEFLLTISRSTTKAGVQRSLVNSVLLAILKRCTGQTQRLEFCLMEAVFKFKTLRNLSHNSKKQSAICNQTHVLPSGWRLHTYTASTIHSSDSGPSQNHRACARKGAEPGSNSLTASAGILKIPYKKVRFCISAKHDKNYN